MCLSYIVQGGFEGTPPPPTEKIFYLGVAIWTCDILRDKRCTICLVLKEKAFENQNFSLGRPPTPRPPYSEIFFCTPPPPSVKVKWAVTGVCLHMVCKYVSLLFMQYRNEKILFMNNNVRLILIINIISNRYHVECYRFLLNMEAGIPKAIFRYK